MPIQRIKRKIEDLRQQPEPVRLRAATIMTAISGGVLFVLWITILLPLQLKFGGSATSEDTQAPVAVVVSTPTPNPTSLFSLEATPTPAVAGIQASKAPQLPLSTTLVSPTPSSTSTPVEVTP